MFRSLAVVALVCLTASMAQADPTQFFGEDLFPGGSLAGMPNSQAARAAFLSNLVGVGNEDFEGFADGAANNLVLNFGIAGTATLTASSGFAQIASSPSLGRFATSPRKYFQTLAGPGNNFVVNFSNPVAAFGFYGTDFGDFAGQMTVTLAGGSNAVIDIPHTVGGPNGSGIFFGLIAFNAADTFTSITFSASNGDDAFGFDDMVVGSLQQVVPEPASLALVGLGIGVLALRRRRRQS